MENELSSNKSKAQLLLANAISDISRITKQTLVDYVKETYKTSFAKVLAYLEIDSQEGQEILKSLEAEFREQVVLISKNFNKDDKTVISEVEHIITSNDIKIDERYKVLKDNLIPSGKDFAEKAITKFRKDTPIFKKKIDKCLFSFEDIINLDDRAIQKILRDTDQQQLAIALRGAPLEVQDKFFRNMTIRESSMLKEDMEWMGPVLISRIEENQASIIKTILKLEELGEIRIFSTDAIGTELL